MNAFQVDDMSCRHCVNAVMHAVKRVDAGAYVSVNLATKRVEVDSRRADARLLEAAIAAAGYAPVAVEAGLT